MHEDGDGTMSCFPFVLENVPNVIEERVFLEYLPWMKFFLNYGIG